MTDEICLYLKSLFPLAWLYNNILLFYHNSLQIYLELLLKIKKGSVPISENPFQLNSYTQRKISLYFALGLLVINCRSFTKDAPRPSLTSSSFHSLAAAQQEKDFKIKNNSWEVTGFMYSISIAVFFIHFSICRFIMYFWKWVGNIWLNWLLMSHVRTRTTVWNFHRETTLYLQFQCFLLHIFLPYLSTRVFLEVNPGVRDKNEVND